MSTSFRLHTWLAIFHLTQHSVLLIELDLVDVYFTEKITRKCLELIGRFHQPPQHRVRVNLKHPGGGPHAQTFGQARQHADDQLHGDLIAMKDRAVMLRKIALARGTVALSPRSTTGMAIGA